MVWVWLSWCGLGFVGCLVRLFCWMVVLCVFRFMSILVVCV